jgi:arylformamidase
MEMTRILDITLTISSIMPTWPSDPCVVLERMSKIEDGANANVSRMVMGVHTGTHVDAPIHFLPGTTGVDVLPLDILIGPVQVIHLSDAVDSINAEVIRRAGLKPGTQRVLFRTRNSDYWANNENQFQKGFVAIPLDGAQCLVELGVRLVGIDYLSISPYKNSRPTHETLLKANMIVLEGVDLSQVPEGIYQLICLPLKLSGCDGAPARVVLLQD